MKASLVKDSEKTGVSRKYYLIDGTAREFQMADVYVLTPFFTGKLEAMIMPDPLYDVIVGNISGARKPDDPGPCSHARSCGRE